MNPKDDIAEIKDLLKTDRHEEAFRTIRRASSPWLDFAAQHKLSRLFNKLDKGALRLTPIRVSLLGTNTLDHFSESLRLFLGLEGLDAEIQITEFNTIEQNVLDPSSELYRFKPEFVWFFSTYRDVAPPPPPSASTADIEDAVQSEVRRLSNLWAHVKKNSKAFILQNAVDVPAWRQLGHFESSVAWAEASFLRAVNLGLTRHLEPGVAVFDLDHVASLFGKRNWVDERYWYHSKHAFSLDANALVAHNGAKLIASSKGLAKKCLVLDLDNTLWGGVIGDDGLGGIKLGNGSDGEAFVDFQKYCLELKRRGVILAVCSKNEEANAREPFVKHPDMVLKSNDIACFVANWKNKAENIRQIAATLEIGLESFVFVDDNPVERGLVRDLLPMVAVPEMPVDPAGYIRALDEHRFFETVTFSEEDLQRGEMYRGNAERKSLREQITDINEYLKSLNMKAVAKDFDDFHVPRIAQLINKSNQFHLTTTRYSESEVKTFMADPNTVGRYYKLTDKFGDNGLISVVILKWHPQEKELVVDTWLMSCRVLSRGMEQFVQNDIVAQARRLGARTITGRYLPTAKNKLVLNHYRDMGYKRVSEDNGATTWAMDVGSESATRPVFIEEVP